jgi:hypothetical protein
MVRHHVSPRRPSARSIGGEGAKCRAPHRGRAAVAGATPTDRSRPDRTWQLRPALVSLLLALLLTLGLLPAAARADGPIAPIATDYRATLTHSPPGVQAKIVDGYLTLWLRVPDRATRVTVLDFRGVPWVRYDPAGVQINTSSEEYYLSQTPVPESVPANLTARTPPHWIAVSSGRSYEWRDGRLHALASIALAPGASYVGSWRIPLLVDGRPSELSGAIYHRGAPSIIWFWPIVVILACVLAAWRIRDPDLDRRLSNGLSGTLLLGIAVAAIARYLHGRPSVTAGELAELAVILALVAVGAVRLRSGRSGYALALLVAFAALWAGLTIAPALTNGYVLLALPALAVRVAAVVLLGGGFGLILLALRALDPVGARGRQRERAHVAA